VEGILVTSPILRFVVVAGCVWAIDLLLIGIVGGILCVLMVMGAWGGAVGGGDPRDSFWAGFRLLDFLALPSSIWWPSTKTEFITLVVVYPMNGICWGVAAGAVDFARRPRRTSVAQLSMDE
jgi:hypothetical protein